MALIAPHTPELGAVAIFGSELAELDLAHRFQDLPRGVFSFGRSGAVNQRLANAFRRRGRMNNKRGVPEAAINLMALRRPHRTPAFPGPGTGCNYETIVTLWDYPASHVDHIHRLETCHLSFLDKLNSRSKRVHSSRKKGLIDI